MSTAAPTRPARRAPAVDPRIQERIRNLARLRARRRLRVVVAMVLAAILAVTAWLVLHSSAFSARVVVVHGAVGGRAAAVLRAAGLQRHPPLLDVDPAAAATAVEALPWVLRANVVRHWPDGVSVTVTTRVPVAQMAVGGGAAVLDRTGRVLSRSPAPVPGLPMVSAPVQPGAPGSWVAVAAEPGLIVASTVPPAFRAQVARVVVDAQGHVQLDLTTPVSVDVGSDTQLHQKYEDVAALLAGAPLAAGDIIDVTVPDAPTISGP